MKGLWLVTIILIAFFCLTFALAAVTGFLSEEQVRQQVDAIRQSPDAFTLIALGVVVLLALDLLLPVPSVPIILVAGNVIGWFPAGVTATVGLMIGSLVGYLACRWGGQHAFQRFVKPHESERARAWFNTNGLLAIIVSRPIPMLPELLACLGGFTRMSFARFALAFFLGTVPFAFACSIAGAASNVDNPWPGITVGIALPAVGWLIWRSATRKVTLDPAQSEPQPQVSTDDHA